jgi:hypothetical protein
MQPVIIYRVRLKDSLDLYNIIEKQGFNVPSILTGDVGRRRFGDYTESVSAQPKPMWN